MTYIKPQGKRYWFFGLVLILIIFVPLYIYFYNQISILRYQKNLFKKEISRKNQTALTLKEKVYGLTNPVYLEKVAKEQNLILDSSPNYLSYL